MVSKYFIQQVKDRNSRKNGSLKKLKKPPKWLFPNSSERQYIASLYAYTLAIRKAISEQLLPKIPRWLLGATFNNPDPVVPSQKESNQLYTKFDSIIDDVINDLEFTLLIIQEILQPSQATAINSASFIGLEISRFNKVQYTKTTNSVLGVDIFLEEPWLETQLELFANQNSQLIKNMTKNELERVSGIVQRGLQDGSSLDSVTETIEKSFGITRRHAKLIARDQTTKLNGSLTKLRQQEVGITEYRWQTSGDERVRADHKALDGKLCRWDDPTVYYNEASKKWENRKNIGGTLVNPSQDINCRCIALPVIEGIFDGK